MRSALWYPHVASPTVARPRVFAFTPDAPLWKGCQFFAGGCNPGSVRAEDSSQYRNHGTLTNMDMPTDAVFDAELRRTCWDFDGSNDYIALGTILDGLDAFTLTSWIRPSDLGAGIIISKYSAVPCEFELGASSVSNAYYVRVDVAAGGRFGYAATPLVQDTWLSVIGTYSGGLRGTLTCYRDASPGTPTTLVADRSATRNDPVQIGTRPYVGAEEPYAGRIADPGIWSRVLTAKELTTLANRSDAMLDGALYDPSRVSVAPGYAASASPWLYASRRSQIIGSGLGV